MFPWVVFLAVALTASSDRVAHAEEDAAPAADAEQKPVVLPMTPPPQALPLRREPIVPKERDFRRFSDWAWLALGATAGFVGHELGHVVTDFMTLHHPTFHATKTGPFYFFAIQPCCGSLTRAEEYAIASAGLQVNNLASELILSISPRIRGRHAPFLKGVLLADVGLSLGYAISGFVQSAHPKGFPSQSDVGSMSRALGAKPWQVGIMVMAPALLDLYRYFVPGSVWAPWASIESKIFMTGIVLPLL